MKTWKIKSFFHEVQRVVLPLPFIRCREIQRTLMELLNQLDGFEDLGQVKMVMATNRPGEATDDPLR